MTTFTETQLATRVLKDLGIIGAEETPTSADLEWAKETASSEIDLLAAKSISIWNGSGDSIPNEYLTALSRRICLAVSPSYGNMSVAEVTAALQSLEGELRALSAKPQTGEVVEATHF